MEDARGGGVLSRGGESRVVGTGSRTFAWRWSLSLGAVELELRYCEMGFELDD